MVRSHIELQSDITSADAAGHTALDLAIWNMHSETVRLILNAISETIPKSALRPKSYFNNALVYAVINDDSIVLKLLFAAGADC